MHKIVLFGAGKSSGSLINYLAKESRALSWSFKVADAHPAASTIEILIKNEIPIIKLDVQDAQARTELIKDADIIISLLPPGLHQIIAQDCLEMGKNLLTASYVDEPLRKMDGALKSKGILFLCEMGLDPGIDHMSAMQLIDRIKKEGGRISEFKSHTGGLVAPENDNNPWHYKISWNPRNVVRAGAAGAVFKQSNVIRKLSYKEVFDNCVGVNVPGLGNLAYYPNRDSLSYMKLYGVEEAKTFLRSTLRYPVFCKNWKWIVAAGLTDDQKIIKDKKIRFSEWSEPILPFVKEDNRQMFSFLGFFDDSPIPGTVNTNADLLQYLLESRLAMQPHDKDMIVMLHELDIEKETTTEFVRSSLLVTGEDSVKTAMAKTVGLPIGIAAKLILEKKIRLTGLHIPIIPEIYEPVLDELTKHGIRFHEEIIH
ncbi:MAG: saccharopine dehydrogenase [Bacteroidetes bacterium]|nr:MAG: saccharopine dehydrogenase [Bacteroidota bacterium]